MAKNNVSRQSLSLKQGESLQNLGQKEIWPDCKAKDKGLYASWFYTDTSDYQG